jgi:hypothetical protein
MTDARYTKRDFLKKLGIGLGSLAVSSTVFKGIESLINTADAETHDSASGYAESAVHVPTMAEIEMLMARGSVDEILNEEYGTRVKKGTIEQIKRKPQSIITNFRDLVYQEEKDALDKRPSLVMFYVNSEKSKNASPREAIIFKSLANRFSGKVNFFTYDISIQEKYKKRKIFDSSFGNEVQKNEGIVEIPAIGMYSVFDLAEYETPDINDGLIKQVDILKGGPDDNKWIPEWITSLTGYWIKPNLFAEQSPENNGKLYRFKNTFDYQEIKGFKYQ